MSSDRLKILPLGGLGEVGMNCLALEWRGEMVLIDCGVQFPDSRYAGVDFLIPDFSYVKERVKDLKGIVVTHGHDDHIGAIPYLAQITDLDIYCSRFAQGLITNKLEEFSGVKEVRFHEYRPKKHFKVGHFTFEPIPVRHSIIEAFGFGIKTPLGNIVHSGDFKQDNTGVGQDRVGFGPFREWAKKGVLLLFSDSTNAERHGHTLSEAEVTRSFEQILADQTGRIFIALFASNIRRIGNLIKIAKKHGKHVALAGRSMHSYVKLAHEQSAIKIPEDTLVLLENIHQYPDDKLVVLLTGSQAEPQSALLRVAHGMHKQLKIRNGDHVFLSSRFIPGNERSITSMINHLYRQGAEVTYEAIECIHVSGHGFQDELTKMLKTVKPEYFIPVHGEFRHLTMHSRLAKASGVDAQKIRIIEDGQIMWLGSDGLDVGEKLQMVKGVVAGGVAMDPTPATFTQRINLSKTGVLTVTIVRGDNRKLAVPPQIKAYGVVLRRGLDHEKTLQEAEKHIEEIYPQILEEEDENEIIRLELRRFFKKRASHKPMVISTFVDI